MTEAKKARRLANRRVAAIAVAVSVLAAAGATVFACGDHHHRMSPERLRKIVSWKVDDLLDEVDADDSQRLEIEGIAGEITEDFLAIHADRDRHRETILEELGRGDPDGDLLHERLDEKLDTIGSFAHRTLDRLLDAHALLTGEQRAILSEHVREHMEDH